jgi:hypothetical protein
LKAPFRTRIEQPALSAEVHAELREELREDVERLRSHSGLGLAGWSL